MVGWITDLAHNRDDLREVKRAQDLSPSLHEFVPRPRIEITSVAARTLSTPTLTTRPPRIYVPRYLAATVPDPGPQIKLVDPIRLAPPIRSIMMLGRTLGSEGNGIERFSNRWTFQPATENRPFCHFLTDRWINVCYVYRMFVNAEVSDFERFGWSWKKVIWRMAEWRVGLFTRG